MVVGLCRMVMSNKGVFFVGIYYLENYYLREAYDY